MVQKLLLPALAATTMLTPLAALAQFRQVGGGGTTKICEIINQAFSVVGVFGTIILIVALLILLYAAFLFLTAAGDPEKTKTARNYLIYALIGLALAFLLIFADDIIVQLFGNTGSFITNCLGINVFQ